MNKNLSVLPWAIVVVAAIHALKIHDIWVAISDALLSVAYLIYYYGSVAPHQLDVDHSSRPIRTMVQQAVWVQFLLIIGALSLSFFVWRLGHPK